MFNFDEAAKRHFGDAELLLEEKRLPNADQLFGLAAECALKAVMVQLGTPTTPQGDLEKSHSHIDKLWSEFQAFVSGFRGARCMKPLAAFTDNPFGDWHVSQRYSANAYCASPASVIAHQKASKACLVALSRSISNI